MPSGIADDTTGYDKVSELIGTRINEAFESLLQELIESGNLNSFAAEGVTLSQAEVENFITVLGGAGLDITFTPKLVKGRITKFKAKDIKPPAGLLGLSGNISAGGCSGF